MPVLGVSILETTAPSATLVHVSPRRQIAGSSESKKDAAIFANGKSLGTIHVGMEARLRGGVWCRPWYLKMLS